MGIALISVIPLHVYFGRLYERLGERGITSTQGEIRRGWEFVRRAEQEGIQRISAPPGIREVIGEFEAAHVYAFQIAFGLMGGDRGPRRRGGLLTPRPPGRPRSSCGRHQPPLTVGLERQRGMSGDLPRAEPCEDR